LARRAWQLARACGNGRPRAVRDGRGRDGRIGGGLVETSAGARPRGTLARGGYMTQDDRSSHTPEPESPPPADESTPTPGKAERETTFTRRALLQAGWTAPVIVAATLPETAYAQRAHSDTAHADSHGDRHAGASPAD